jgi:tetratricopeptide (TPR) repeat protein/predicted Ser/Thr protein kinase
MSCLDENSLGAYVERALPVDEVAAVSAHLDGCEDCLTIACAIVRVEAADTRQILRETVGRYAIISLLGRGGMGSVYLAHDPQLDRKIALKVVRGHALGDGDRARLSAEARAMAKVVHAHVVTVYDAGELPDGVFIAMELVDGHTLRAWLAEAARPWREIVRMFVQVGQGLSAAHAAGIVHRDFKPDNVLVDRRGRAAVSDFGLAIAEARPVDRGGALGALAIAAATQATRAQGIAGTPLYMSPEQLSGGAIDARSDQFSFGVALYGALYRVRPFAGETLGELADNVIAGRVRPRPATTRVPARVHQVLERALRAEPSARFPSLAALLDALGAAARPRWPARVAIAGVIAVAAAGAVAVLATGGDRPPRSPAPAAAAPAVAAAAAAATVPAFQTGAGAPRVSVIVAPFANTTGDPRFDDTLDAQLAATLARSTRIDTLFGASLAHAQGSRDHGRTLDQLADAKPPAIILRGTVAAAGSGYTVKLDARGTPGVPVRLELQRAAGSPAEALAAVAELGSVVRAAIGDPAADAGDSLVTTSLDALHAWAHAQVLADGSAPPAELAALHQAIALDPSFALAHANLGIDQLNAGHRALAEQELAFVARDGARMPERWRLSLLASYYRSAGRYAESIEAYQQVLVTWPGDKVAMFNIPNTALEAGSWTLALEFARRAATIPGAPPSVPANVVVAEVGNGLFAEAIADGKAVLAAGPRPSAGGVVGIAIAHELDGDGSAARATLASLGSDAGEIAELAEVDFELFERRDADAETRATRAIDLGAKATPPRAELVMHQLRGYARLRRGDRAGAGSDVLAAAGEDERQDYLAASLAAEAGATAGLTAKAHAWRDADDIERRIAGELLEGDLALAAHRPRDAIAAYARSGRIAATWIERARLGRAYAAEKDWANAERELAWCHEHRGEGALYNSPSLRLLPDVQDLLAKVRAELAKTGTPN